MTVPPRPKIYHITHVENLVAVAREGLVSDAEMVRRGGPSVPIGMSEIKRRRIEERPVSVVPDTNVGDFVPFYFCPRSVMLFVIFKGNHPDLAYRGGQGPIVHLEADLDTVIAWADANDAPWAFSLSNAGGKYAEFRSDPAHLGQINWSAVAATDFRDSIVKEGKQAEFLLYGAFPWDLVERIGVHSQAIQAQARAALRGSAHTPTVDVLRDWYF